jgi:putative tricarboxylic transport membrane protein
MLESFGLGFSIALRPESLIAMVVGVGWGILGGALPGISGSIAMALLLPLTFGLDASVALMMLAGVWAGAGYGGSIPAILIKTPGTASAAAAIFDGFELHRQGKTGKALGVSLVTGTIGGLVSVIFLIALLVPLSRITLAFGPPEYFAVALFGLVIISSLSEHAMLKGLISGFFGLAIAVVGVDPLSAVQRFTFGRLELYEGFELVAVLIGLFAVTEMLTQAGRLAQWRKITDTATSTAMPTLGELRGVGRATTVGAIVGLIVGVMPGAGQTVASFVAYNEAKRWSKHPEQFGKGSLEGVAAPETANNAVQGGDLVPALALGIPGSNSAAIMLAALVLHGLRPGPMLFTTNPEVVYSLFAGLIIVNFLMLVIGFLILRLCMLVVNVPVPYLITGVLSLVIVGSYSINNSSFDPLVAVAFGAVGYLMNRYGFSPAATVLGLLLGYLVEISMRRALIMSNVGWAIFVERPIALAFVILSVLTLLYPFVMRWRAARRQRATAVDDSHPAPA